MDFDDNKDHQQQQLLYEDYSGLVGLKNLGNTCYINGALQALSNCQQLTKFMLECPGYLAKTGLCKSYTDLVREIWHPQQEEYIVPSGIIRNIKCFLPAFRGCTQQDTQEFLRCFLEQLHEELKRSKFKKPRVKQQHIHISSSSINQEGGDKTTGATIDVTSKTTTPPTSDLTDDGHKSIISDTFEFKILSSVVCSCCNNISTTKETFKDLSIPIPNRDHPFYLSVSKSSDSNDGNTTKTDCEFSDASDNLDDSKNNNDDDENDDLDEGDQTSSDLLRTISYNPSMIISGLLWSWWASIKEYFLGHKVSLEDCLLIFFGTDPLEGDNEYSCDVCTRKNRGVKYLKILELPEVLCIHFKRYEQTNYSSKINAFVSFPLTGLNLEPFMSPESRSQCTTYDLVACICHHGSALYNGHYTTYAKNCHDNQWYEFDDQFVQSVETSIVENAEAYILFYQKADPADSVTDRRITAEKLFKKSLKQGDNMKRYYISRFWVNKFTTFVEPGPITNHDFLCEHKKVPKSVLPEVNNLCQSINETLWSYLKDLYGGGPECVALEECSECE